MQLALRRAYGMGGLGFCDPSDPACVGAELPVEGEVISVDRFDPSTIYAAPGFNITTTPGVELTPAELVAEQSRASAWLAQIPGVLSTASKIASLTSAQITAGLKAGALKPSSTCPSGYLVAGSAQCVATSSSSGVSGQTLAIAAIVIFGLMLMGKK